ncbi:MAG TPA: peptidylprolyl isomerase [Schlesneria sp.]
MKSVSKAIHMFQISRGHRELVTYGRRVLRFGLALRCCLLLASLSVLTTSGCNALKGMGKKHDNPVLIEAPHRVAGLANDSDDETKIVEADDIETPEKTKVVATAAIAPVGTDPWAEWTDDTAIYNSKIAATVNGFPILNGDVLDRYSGYLIDMRKSMREKRVAPSEYEKVREMFVQRDLPSHIQRRLLVETMKSSLKTEQIKLLNDHLDAMFEKEVEKLKRELKVSTRTELELELNKKGTTLQNVRDQFATERMAMEYVSMKMEKPDHIDRMDLLAYYQSHLEDYAVAAHVTWEQIQVSVTPSMSKAKARERMQEALQELSSGTSFDAVAKKYSDGPTSKDGGLREEMEVGSLKDTKLEKMLFDMPVGKLSSVYEAPEEFQLVRVKKRAAAGRQQFGDVQDEIRQKMENEQNKKRPEKLFKKLFSEAIIETKYDLRSIAPK